MKNIVLQVILAFSLLGFVGCEPYGKKVKINEQLEVYAKRDATEAEAKKLGDYLQSLDTENKNQKSFQLEKDKDVYTIRMVIPEEALKNNELDESFQALQLLIKENVFPGKSVKLILADDQFKNRKAIPEMTSLPTEADAAGEAAGTAVDSASAQ
jgi:hypothetical protein